MIERPYAADLNSLFAQLGSSPSGLSQAEAKLRLERFGLNEIPAKDRRTALSIILSQFKSPLILILIAASILAGVFLGDSTEAEIIVAIVLVSTILGFYQEYKSEKALAELRRYISFKAKVLRDGKKTAIDVKQLVPGDIVFLNIGDLVPADLRLIEAQELTINESVVTGESFPTHKIAGDIKQQSAQEAQQKNIALMGTTVVNGEGKGIVAATGENTMFGKTATILSAKEPPTDFQKNIKKFGNFLIRIIIFLTTFAFVTNFLLGRSDSLLFALALAVGVTPELLPIIITIGLSRGAIHLAKKKVVVKKLIAIEDLGNIDVLCMDKTGTLTENKVSLTDFFDADGNRQDELLLFAALCNNAAMENGKAVGNPIDAAILDYASQKNIAMDDWKEIEEIGFDYERRRMSAIVEKNGKSLIICKGAPEAVLQKCVSAKIKGKAISIKKMENGLRLKFEELSRKGYRLVAVAYRKIGKKDDYTAEDEKDLVFLGTLVFSDPPKISAAEAIKKIQTLEVELKVLTGDNELLTQQVCNQLGFEIKNRVISGAELEKMGKQEFKKTIAENNVFARISPEQKFRIVKVLSEQGHIVGFLGDGVNDTPSIKAADVGITVDSAVDVAKDSADMILLEKDLSVLVDGIIEGRKTFGNIIKYILNTISANFGNMFSLTISPLFLPFIPLKASQILLANLISDGPLMTISTDDVDKETLRKPKRWNLKAISKFMIFFGAISSIFDLITMATLLIIINADKMLFMTAWFLESVLSEIIVTFSIRTKRPLWRSKPSRMLLLTSIAAMALTLGLIYSPFAFLFEFKQLSIPLLGAIGIILLAYLVLVEIAKKIFYKTHEI
jgi:Mg2+-importing ATPase